jgi:hypothetical protein
MRPFGDALIFQSFGYSFDDVRQVNAEELGIYKRGRIITLEEMHPDGTLFLDQDTHILWLKKEGRLFSLDESSRDFLLGRNTPIRVSSTEKSQGTECILTTSFWKGTFVCQADLSSLVGKSSNYAFTLENIKEEQDIETLTVGMQTSYKKENALTVLSKIRSRVLERFGIGYE